MKIKWCTMRRPEALVAVESPLARDPRVRRQIAWLLEDGYDVDSLGIGDAPAEPVREHFRLADAPGPSAWDTIRRYFFSSRIDAFEELTLVRFPSELRARVREGHYDLIILNDRHFAPWVRSRSDFPAGGPARRIHLDLHEYFVPKLPRNSLWSAVAGPYYSWSRRQFADPAFTSRSTVNEGIAALYAEELGVDEWAVIRNSPPYVDLEPSTVAPNTVRMIHHGAARWDRGIREILDAMSMLDNRFEMTFMLLGDPTVEAEIARRAAEIGEHVRVVPPVSSTGITGAIHPYDLEVMFYPPRTKNLELALPNKFFEAVQARLGLVVGASPMMADLVDRYGNGVRVEGWTAADLARTLSSLTTEQVRTFKAASDRAARDLNAEMEKDVFLSAVNANHAGSTL